MSIFSNILKRIELVAERGYARTAIDIAGRAFASEEDDFKSLEKHGLIRIGYSDDSEEYPMIAAMWIDGATLYLPLILMVFEGDETGARKNAVERVIHNFNASFHNIGHARGATHIDDYSIVEVSQLSQPMLYVEGELINIAEIGVEKAIEIAAGHVPDETIEAIRKFGGDKQQTMMMVLVRNSAKPELYEFAASMDSQSGVKEETNH